MTPNADYVGHLRALSLGAGVQSTTVLLLSLAGRIDPYEAIVFADTGDEPAAVYEHLERLDEVATISRVSKGRLSDTARSTYVPIPVYDGHGGMGVRQCTNQYKLRPIRRHLRSLGASQVDLAVCISTDEYTRAKDSGLKWCKNVFPLLDLGWARADCLTYLAERWPWPVPRSACVYCPLRPDRQFIDLRENHPDDWAAAVAFDESLRANGHGSYVHRSERPLADAVLRPEDAGQMNLFDQECEGMCGV